MPSPFVKGNKLGTGRPKGSSNKNFMSCQYWYRLISENAEDLKATEKIEIAFRALGLLMPKVQSLPAEPGDSVSNATEAMEMLKKMENPVEEIEHP